MKIKAIVLNETTAFDSFEQLQAEMQPVPDYDEETVDLVILLETDKGPFRQDMKIGPNALTGAEPHILEALVFEVVEANKVYRNAAPPEK